MDIQPIQITGIVNVPETNDLVSALSYDRMMS